MKAELIEHYKHYIRNSYLLEVRVWRVDDRRYRYGLKYSLIFIEHKTQKKVLMDNHYPKGPHIHIDNTESDYEFKNMENLIIDFRNLIFKHFGERI